MKRDWNGIVYVGFGIVLVLLSILADAVWSDLCLCVAGVMIGFGIKTYFWPNSREDNPKENDSDSQSQKQETESLKHQSARHAYILGLCVVSISIILLSMFRRWGWIEGEFLLEWYLGGYLVFQIAAEAIIRYYLRHKRK
ncbi:MAG: hypothetical protein ACOX60_00655 [Massiliimalia sp.]|jgi:hypothetical protein